MKNTFLMLVEPAVRLCSVQGRRRISVIHYLAADEVKSQLSFEHLNRGSEIRSESPNIKLTWTVDMQVRDWPREAGGTERGGPAHPADSGAGALAEGDDGAALQPVHGRARGQSPRWVQSGPTEIHAGVCACPSPLSRARTHIHTHS